MKRTEQYQFFALGVRGARAFLEQFQWEPYKELRARKAKFRNFVEGKGGLQNPSEDPGSAPGPAA